MDIHTITNYFYQYGSIIVFVIVLLEYLNLPGFPAGVIMPLTGFWAVNGQISLREVLLLTELAGMTGSWTLYFLGRYGGEFVLKQYLKKFPKHTKHVENITQRIRGKGMKKYFWLVVVKLTPVARTIVSIPAGTFRMNFLGYTISSALGVFIWNAVLIGAGYFFGELILF